MKKFFLLAVLSFLFVGTTSMVQASNLKRYFVTNVFDSSDKIIVEDSYGDQYLVEYGIGCLSMWRYEDKYIHIDIGGSFLDGIGDRIYLIDSEQDCRVWDVDELGTSDSSYYYTAPSTPTYTPPPTPKCPINSSLGADSKCYCNSGYQLLNGQCVTHTAACQMSHGFNSYGDKDYCYCNTGYVFNENKTCVLKPPVILTSPKLPTPTTVDTRDNTGQKTIPKDFQVSSNDIEILNSNGILKKAATFRKCPSTDCSIIRYYAETSTVEISGKYTKGDWYQIEGTTDAGGAGERIVGWIHTSLFEKVATNGEVTGTESVIETSTNTVSSTQYKGNFFRRILDRVIGWFK